MIHACRRQHPVRLLWTPSASLFQRPAFLPLSPFAPTYYQPLPLPHAIDVPLCHVLAVRQLAQVLQLVFCSRYPERILVQGLEASEAELRRGGARRALAHLITETKRFGDRQQCSHREERRALFDGLGEDAASSPGDDGVDTAENLGCAIISSLVSVLIYYYQVLVELWRY